MLRRIFLTVVAIALACLLLRAAGIGITGDYLDPVAHLSAQDEAFYSNSAIHMAAHGNWLTPEFMGRYSFYKPPLFMWLAAASSRLFGISRFTLRLPLALICSLAVGLVFLIGAKMRSWQTGAAAALLVISNHLWNVSAAMVLTDALLAAFAISALFCVFTDPRLDSRAAFWGFAASIAGAILTKTIAGALPLGAFGLYWLVAGRELRAPFVRACLVIAASLALAAPWFAYQLMVHHDWFWTEHVLQEILGFGGGVTAQQTTAESHANFYLTRLIAIEPVLFALFLAALPGFLVDLKRRRPEALWLACWLAPVLAAPFVWNYRSATYLIPSIAPMAVAAACYWPLNRRANYSLLAVVGAAALSALAFPTRTWGLSFATGSIQQAAAPLQNYCEWNRGNELISVEMTDDLYASTLPLPRLRYAIVSPSMTGHEYIMLDFARMGISVTPDQFNHIEQWRPQFRDSLRAAGLDSGEPIATLIVAQDRQQLLSVVRAHPLSDFLFPASYRTEVTSGSFEGRIVDAGKSLFFLLANHQEPRANPTAWTCRM